jgi:hypothetical protein
MPGDSSCNSALAAAVLGTATAVDQLQEWGHATYQMGINSSRWCTSTSSVGSSRRSVSAEIGLRVQQQAN